MSGPDKQSEMTPRTILSVTAAQTVLFALAGWGLWHLSGFEEIAMITFAPWEVGLGLALAAGLIATGIIIIRVFPAYGDWIIRSQAANYPFLKDRLSIGGIVFLSICAGLGEEVLFRGGLQTLIAQAAPIWLAIVLAAAVFAAIHLAKPIVSLLILLIGVLFGVAYTWSGSLLAVIIGHAVYDIWALWYLQEGMHRLGVFGDDTQASADAPAGD